MRPRSAEILHPRMGDFYTLQAETFYRVPQKPGLLAGRFYKRRGKVRPHYLYRDARKPTSTAHVSQTPGTKQWLVQETTQRIKNVVNQYPTYIPCAYDIRKVVESKKRGVFLQVPAPVVAEAQPPGSSLYLHQAKSIRRAFHVKHVATTRICSNKFLSSAVY